MRRLWMSVLLAPGLALAVPAVAMATPAVPAERTAPATAPVQFGQHGSAVRKLQRRLAALKYYPGAIDGTFSTSTLEAVWAFQEVQGLAGPGFVSARRQRALNHPPAPRGPHPAPRPTRLDGKLRIRVPVPCPHHHAPP